LEWCGQFSRSPGIHQ